MPQKPDGFAQEGLSLIRAIRKAEQAEQPKGADASAPQFLQTREELRRQIRRLLLQVGTAIDGKTTSGKTNPADELFGVLTQLADTVISWDQEGQPFNPGTLEQFRSRLERLCATQN
ncbi:MAG: hypothetical protein PHE68_05425 [Candidatus Peribacteraceae bacterium]|nr:hypothetical protein [Candidatus Peribacteraceae bacterium]MDD5074488.1 hypothetical protein [Candidatus Peribacteraceae bacterium]